MKKNRIHRIGRGKNMSIAKAALVWFYNNMNKHAGFVDWGDLDFIHGVVDIAGANHCSFLTAGQVCTCINNSPYWTGEMVYGFYNGIGNNHAKLYQPTEKGKEYYINNLKK